MDFEVKYFQTNTYGRMVGTVPNREKDLELLSIIPGIKEDIEKDTALSYLISDQKRVHESVKCAMERYSADKSLNFNVFSHSEDARGRPLDRFIISNDKWRVIVDLRAELDVSIDISCVRRFACLHLPKKLSKPFQPDVFIPHIHYLLRIWNTPTGFYEVILYDIPMQIPYSYEVERDRKIVGLPKFISPEEKKLYERTDFDVRRAVFQETFDLFKR